MQAVQELRDRVKALGLNPYATARKLRLPHMTVLRFLRGGNSKSTTLALIEARLAKLQSMDR